MVDASLFGLSRTPRFDAEAGEMRYFAEAVDKSLDNLAQVIGDKKAFRELLFGEADGV